MRRDYPWSLQNLNLQKHVYQTETARINSVHR